ncbi:MAG: tRNA dihydrouridine synthase DusB [Clostridiales bacterium]|nr:tRNA dihydrouridine synthase DusB [Clostridiales bacterium]
MKIGNVQLDNNIMLAPMAGITDMPFRILCREQGCGLVFSEMVSSKGMHYNDQKSGHLAYISPAEMPAAIQLFGREAEIMAEAAQKLNCSNAAIIDINMGCPTPKITKNGEGCALMLEPELAGKIIHAVVKASTKPVTVKIRKGWDDETQNAPLLARIAEDNGAAAVIVHGRTRSQFYSGRADWDVIKQVKNTLSIPVIGNGDVFSPLEAKRMFEITSCDGVMIGRAAQGNPWIFSRTIHFLKTGNLLPAPSPHEKSSIILCHLAMLVELKGEHTGILEMRKHLAWYTKGVKNSATLRDQVFRMSSMADAVKLILEAFHSE